MGSGLPSLSQQATPPDTGLSRTEKLAKILNRSLRSDGCGFVLAGGRLPGGTELTTCRKPGANPCSFRLRLRRGFKKLMRPTVMVVKVKTMFHKILPPTIVLRNHVFACGLRPVQFLLHPCLFMFHKIHLHLRPCLCLGRCKARHLANFRARALDKTLSSVSESTAVLSFRHVPTTSLSQQASDSAPCQGLSVSTAQRVQLPNDKLFGIRVLILVVQPLREYIGPSGLQNHDWSSHHFGHS